MDSCSTSRGKTATSCVGPRWLCAFFIASLPTSESYWLGKPHRRNESLTRSCFESTVVGFGQTMDVSMTGSSFRFKKILPLRQFVKLKCAHIRCLPLSDSLPDSLGCVAYLPLLVLFCSLWLGQRTGSSQWYGPSGQRAEDSDKQHSKSGSLVVVEDTNDNFQSTVDLFGG